ncbi:DUF4192 family protein [Gryllotalpicola reticulitermitis]|uniref:DUF4192 family protein n=1 Tax=Gryllotalpicola reticulitermitis TaxID=1184153 RepID=A0ABV8Q6I7_9MICO
MTSLAPSDDTLIRLRTPRDVLSMVPRLLGYRPRGSLVLVNVHEDSAVSTMRVDLPQTGCRADEQRFVASLTTMLRKVPSVRSMVLAIYVDEGFESGDDVPRAELVRPLVARLVAAGFNVYDALCVAGDAWGAYDGADAGVAHRLDELEETVPGAEACGPVAASVGELAALPMAGALARRAFEEALDRMLRQGPSTAPVAAAEAALAADPETAGSDELAAVMHALLDFGARDVVLFTWAWGAARGDELVDEIVRIDAGEVGPGDDTIALDLMGLGGAQPPDRERIARAIGLMSRLAALVPEDIAHIALTVLAWLHWSQGRSSLASRVVTRARELDPGYGLAELIELALGRGMLPNWAFLRPNGR